MKPALLVLLLIILVAIAGILLIAGANRFARVPSVAQANFATPPAPKSPGTEVSLVTWNIGYAGMGKDSDFVMDMGSQKRPLSADWVDANLREITRLLPTLDADVYFLQEVARPSYGSHGRDTLAPLMKALPGFGHMFGADIHTRFMPPGLRSRIGNAIFARYPAKEAEYRALPLEPNFTLGIFRKHYRMHIMRLAGETEWVFINIHLSAFDSEDHNVREQQVKALFDVAEQEFERGRHVVIGGDWNLRLSPTEFPHKTEPKYLFWIRDFPQDLVPEGWAWGVDSSTPTVRTAQKPYVHGENYRLIIDGFLVSPNVEILSTSAMDLDFAHTDHHPVRITVRSR